MLTQSLTDDVVMGLSAIGAVYMGGWTGKFAAQRRYARAAFYALISLCFIAVATLEAIR